MVFTSINTFSQSCIITSKANDILPDNLCAPVDVDWEITYRGVDDGGGSDGVNPWTIEIQVDWDDGDIETVTATNTNATTNEWQINISHTYPIGGNRCNYNPNAQLIVDGVICTSSFQEQNVTVWDTDNYNGGQLEITPAVFPICVGSDGSVTFTDVSLWNCVPPVENDNPNGARRWTQWIYGTAYTYNNVEVNGSVQSYPYSGAVLPTISNPSYNPEAPNNTSLPCYGPNTGNVGEYWEITLNNWNYCNPYDQGYDPVTTTAMIIVVDTPDATINPIGPFCENDGSTNLTSVTNGGTWSGNGVSGHSFNPSAAGPGTHTIIHTVISADGCEGMSTLDVTVYAIPTPNILPGNSAEVCPGDILDLDGNPTPGDGAIITHLWTGNTLPLSATNIQAPFFSTNTQGVYNLVYKITDDNGCSNSDNISIAVNPVVANIIPKPAEICEGADLILNGNPSGGTGNYTTHVWIGDVSNLDATNTQSVTFNSNIIGSYNFTYTVTDDNGCTGSDNITVAVYENPIADAGIDDSICSNTINLNAFPTVGVGDWNQIAGPGTTIFADTTNATTSITVDVYGLYTYTWSESFGPSCFDEDTVQIRFTEQPVADAGNDGGICGYVYQLHANPSVGVGTWSMQSGTGNVTFSDINDPNAIVTADAYGNYYLIWTEGNGYGCTDDDSVLVSFNLVPTPSFTPVSPDGCTPFTIDFTNTSTGGTDFNWNFGTGDTSIIENPTYTFYNSTSTDITYNIQLAVNNPGCGDTIIQQVTVHPSPNASFTTNAAPACSPMSADFVNTSMGSDTHIWDWGDNTALDTVDNATHTFINDTTFILNYEVSIIAVSVNACKDTAKQIVTVYPNPNNSFVVTPDSGCTPQIVQFTAGPTGQTYFWDFGNGTTQMGSNITNSIYTYAGNTDTTFNISLITTSYFGCIDTSYNQVTVFPTPEADFYISTNDGCAPLIANFVNTSIGAVNYIWDWGDGSTDTTIINSISHDFGNVSNNAITYTIVLTAINTQGCSSQKTRTLIVYPEVHAFYMADTTGCSALNVDFNNQSSGATTYLWHFGDNSLSTEENPSHLYENNNDFDEHYTAELIATSQYGCSDTYNREIIAYPSPIATFSVTPNIVDLPNAQVAITNSTIGNWTYFWDFGDGSNSGIEQPVSHVYTDYGNYNIWLYVSGTHCSDSIFHQVTVNAPEPIAAYFNSVNGCMPLEVTFANHSQYADTYHWDFGDGNQSNKENPVYTYYDAGTYLVSLTVNGPGGQDTYIGDSIVVYPKAKAFFKVAPSVVFIPDQPIHCYDLSEGDVIIWTWNFGDNKTSYEQNPQHYYEKEGVYDISLTVNTKHNCPDTYIIERAVTAENVGEVSVPNAFTPNQGGPNGGEYDPNNFNNDIFYPVLNGVEADYYVFRIFNRWGELIFETNEKNIGWDGYYRDKECKQDVYVWTVEGKYINGISFFKKGDVTLLR